MKWEVGDRIGAIMRSEEKKVYSLGFGTYLGDEVPPKEIGGFNVGLPNPKLQLDTGQVVWGCECWWGTEEGMKRRLHKWEEAGFEIITVDIDAERARAGGVSRETSEE